MTPWLVAMLVLTALSGGTPVPKNEGRQWATRVANAYRALPWYDMRGTQVVRVSVPGGMSPPIQSALRLAAIRPDRSYTNNEMPMLGTRSVTHGDSTWTYSPEMNVWWGTSAAMDMTRPTAALAVPDLEQLDQLEWTVASRQVVSQTSGQVECIRLCRTATMGDTVNTFVSHDTLWVDTASNLVVRQSTRNVVKPTNEILEMTVDWEQIQVKTPPADSLFTFAPPAGSKRVDAAALSRMRPSATLPPQAAGTPAPSFTLPDVKGTNVSLADLKGRVVLIDFWATWCGPCLIELPHVQKLHQEYAGKGLTVLAITSEASERALPFLEKSGYTFRCLVDAGLIVARKYGVRAIPFTVVIGRDGTIVEQMTGLQSEASLRTALKKAGL